MASLHRRINSGINSETIMTSLGADKRRYPRMRIAYEVEVFHPSLGVSRFQTRDMSHSGMFIVDRKTTLLPVEGEIVRVHINGITLDEPMTVDMRVVRNSSEGKGLAFV